MASDGRVGFVRKPDLGQTDLALTLRLLPQVDFGKKTVQQDSFRFFAGHRYLYRASDERTSPTGNGDGMLLELRRGQQFFFSLTTSVGENLKLPGVEFGALCLETLGHREGQSEIHVVPAQEDMVPDGHSF